MASSDDIPGWHRRVRQQAGPQLFDSADDLPTQGATGDLAIVNDGQSFTLYQFRDGKWRVIATSSAIFPFTGRMALTGFAVGYAIGEEPQTTDTEWNGNQAYRTGIQAGFSLGEETQGTGTSWDGTNVNQT